MLKPIIFDEVLVLHSNDWTMSVSEKRKFSNSKNCCTQLSDNLYLGNQYSTSVIAEVDVIVSIGCNSKSNSPNVTHYKVSVRDNVDSDLTPLFNDVTAFIHQHISTNKKVLVHCKGGINRSPMFVIAYLARYNMTLEEAVLHVTSMRTAARIQPHYLQQVTAWLSKRDDQVVSG